MSESKRKFSKYIILLSLLPLFILFSCATTEVRNRDLSVGTIDNLDRFVEVGRFTNNTGISDPNKIRFNVSLDIPATELVNRLLVSELERAGFSIGESSFIISGTVNSLVYGYKKGTSIKFKVLNKTNNNVLYENTFENGNGAMYIGNEEGQLDQIRACIRLFIKDITPKLVKWDDGSSNTDTSRNIETPDKPKENTVITNIQPASIGEQEKMIITVLDLNVENLSETDGKLITDLLSSALISTGKYRVIDRSQRETVLNEMSFSLSGCVDESCQLELGKLLAADGIIVGSIGKIGSRFVLNIKLLNVETSEAMTTSYKIFSSLEELVDGSEEIAVSLGM